MPQFSGSVGSCCSSFFRSSLRISLSRSRAAAAASSSSSSMTMASSCDDGGASTRAEERPRFSSGDGRAPASKFLVISAQATRLLVVGRRRLLLAFLLLGAAGLFGHFRFPGRARLFFYAVEVRHRPGLLTGELAKHPLPLARAGLAGLLGGVDGRRHARGRRLPHSTLRLLSRERQLPLLLLGLAFLPLLLDDLPQDAQSSFAAGLRVPRSLTKFSQN